jgi:phosphatidylserine/phosphatidylglycerophosphate/cardiolipin synthase-like enzyme
MSCLTTSKIIAEQLWQWVLGILSYLEKVFCTLVTQKVQQWQQQWQKVCSQVASQVLQWQQQWQNQCSQVSSQVCNSLPWPLSLVCNWVTSTVCALVSVLAQVLVTVVQTVCNLVSVLILVLVAVVQVVCPIVRFVLEALVLAAFVVVVAIIFILCTLPCRAPMESSVPPDDGWIVTLGLPTPPKLSEFNHVQILPDGDLACQSMIAAVAAAKKTIHLIQLQFDSDFIATFIGTTAQTKLTSALLAANDRGVRIRILLNDSAAVDSLPGLKTAFAGRPTIELAGLSLKFGGLLPNGSLHAKGMFIDSDVAFVDGLPFMQGYWDTQSHFVSDSRRGTGANADISYLGEVGNGVGDKPVHTVSLQLAGPAAKDVDATFVSLWNSVSSDQVTVPAGGLGLKGRQSVQIVRTAPPLNAVGLSNEKGVLEAYLRAINNARHFIYIEDQYFTSPVIGAALITALNANPGLQLILLLNENPDLPTYKFWQNRLLNQLAVFPATRIGVFTLWRTTPPAANQMAEIMQCYLEAKVAVVDDVWATVGTGNLDGASLGHIFEFLPSPLSCLSAANGWRNVELNAVLYDGIAQQPATGEVARLRQDLWQEHLGQALPTSPPPGGWLALWNDIAAQNVASLNSSQSMTGPANSPSRILPYAPALQTVGQLNQLGVNTSLLNVAPVTPP